MTEQAKIALKSPLTYALLIITGFTSYFITAYNSRSDDSIRSCHEQIERLNTRIDKLEQNLDDYTRAVLFKDVQIKNQTVIIDSLRKGGRNE